MNKWLKKETYTGLIKENINIRTQVGVLLFLVAGFVLWFLPIMLAMENEQIMAILLQDLAVTFWIIGFVGLFYEVFIRRRFEDEMSDALWKSIDADVSLLKDRLKDEAITSIIKNGLEAKLCNPEMARIFYDGLISPYLAIENFRKTFEYEIKLDKLDKDIEANGVNFSKDSYFKVVEKLTYTKRLFIKRDTELVVGLCFNDPQLKYYRDKDCIYRTIFRIKESEKAILKTAPLPRNIFQITIKINGKNLAPVMTSYNDSKGIEIICKYKDEEITTSKETEFEIKIVTLHDRNVNYYTAYLFDPTFSPKIKLHYNDEMKDIFTVIHFTSSKGEDVVPEPDYAMKYILVERKGEWVFPTSGVVFVWEACK